jgi:ribonuclease VapC
MVVHTSALVAILKREAGWERLTGALADAPIKRISAATLVEAGIVIHAMYGDHGESELDLLLSRARIETVAFSDEQSEIARSAFRRFGKGRHPAGLNFGDCFAYALAASLDEPLLFVGNHFARTDIRAA